MHCTSTSYGPNSIRSRFLSRPDVDVSVILAGDARIEDRGRAIRMSPLPEKLLQKSYIKQANHIINDGKLQMNAVFPEISILAANRETISQFLLGFALNN
jgi:hypothetical protein